MRTRRKLGALMVILAVLLALAAWWSGDRFAPRTETIARGDEVATPPAPTGLAAAKPDPSVARPQRTEIGIHQSEAESGSLQVKVMLVPEDTPCEAVLVCCVPLDGRDETFTTRSAVTDAEGIARFERVAAGPWRITTDRWVERETTITPGRCAQVTLGIEHGIDVRGVVLDPQGQPVPGAEIWIYPFTYMRYQEQARAVTSCDATGRFVLRRVGGQAGAWFGARARGYAPSPDVTLFVPNAPAPCEPVLRFEGPGAHLRMRVIDDDSKPIPRAHVLHVPPWVAPREEGGLARAGVVCTDAFTDAHGLAELQDVAPGRSEVIVRARGYAPRSVFAELLGDRVVDLEVQLARGATVVGVVRDTSGQPIPRAKLQLNRRLRATTGALGEYRIAGAPLGDCSASVEAEGHATHKENLHFDAACEVVWNPQLTRHASIRGRIQDARGAPLAGWSAIVQRVRGSGLASASQITDAAGRFTILVDPATTYRLFALAPEQDFAIPCDGVGEITAGETEHQLTIDDAQRGTAHLEGCVVDERGHPQAGFTLELSDELNARNVEVVIDPDTGRFRTGPLPAKTYRLEVGSKNGAIPRFDAGTITLAPGKMCDAGSIRIPAHGLLRYRLRALDGFELSKAPWIFLAVDDEPMREHRKIRCLDVAGTGKIALAPGPRQLKVFGRGFAGVCATVEIALGETSEVEIPLAPGVLRTLALHLPPAETSLRIELRDEEGHMVFAEAPRDLDDRPWPRKCLVYLAAGRYVVAAIGAAGKRYRCTFEVASLEPSREVIDLSPR